MPEQEIKPNIDCFGTIDKKNKEGCRHCSNNAMCETFKPKLMQLMADAREDGKQDYINKRNLETALAKSKYIIYGFVVVVLVFLSWVLSQEV
ncbi:MAG TPA: hypothetical protein ENJ51_04325 [Leucothrix mucor]|uniref:Uncharacterized protein n=1 Tax=Leucothrix mucor TaxID=45248 RepID=A0A7V2T228_LEUMU|nr:hypothetical protein [Leucothrix mucor]